MDIQCCDCTCQILFSDGSFKEGAAAPMSLFEKIKENPMLIVAVVIAMLAFFGIIVWFYAALDAQMKALEAGAVY